MPFLEPQDSSACVCAVLLVIAFQDDAHLRASDRRSFAGFAVHKVLLFC